MKSKKNPLPVAPYNLRELGPRSEAELKKALGFFRYAHGVGADRRATLDPAPCPKCRGKVEWALTYRREKGAVVPYIYARCRSAPKSHRWDFTHWVPSKSTPQTAEAMKKALSASMKMAASRKPAPEVVPSPRPSVGTDLMANWLDARIAVLTAELERLSEIRALAGEVVDLEAGRPIPQPRPTHNGHA